MDGDCSGPGMNPPSLFGVVDLPSVPFSTFGRVFKLPVVRRRLGLSQEISLGMEGMPLVGTLDRSRIHNVIIYGSTKRSTLGTSCGRAVVIRCR